MELTSELDVGGVSWIAEDMDVVGAGIIKELKGVVRVMAINNKEACMYISLPCCTFLKVGEPDYSQFAIHLTRYLLPLKMTAGGTLELPSVQIVTMTVMLSRLPVFCWCWICCPAGPTTFRFDEPSPVRNPVSSLP